MEMVQACRWTAALFLLSSACRDRPATPPASPPPASPSIVHVDARRTKVPEGAVRPLPLSLGDDLTRMSRALEGTVLERVTPVAPCLAKVEGDGIQFFDPIIVHGDRVYVIAGGSRRADGTFVICDATNPSVYEIDPKGGATRWRIGFDGVATAESADCRVDTGSVSCRASTWSDIPFDGTIVGDLVVPVDVAHKLGSVRAIRLDRPATDRCDRIVERAWQELAPARAYLELPSDDAARRQYLLSQTLFRGDCDAAPPEAVACLLDAPSVLQRNTACRLSPPGFDWTAPTPAPEPPALDRSEQRRRERALVGTWSRDNGAYDATVWTFDANGNVRVNGKSEGRYSTKCGGCLQFSPSSAEDRFTFAREDADHFYADDPRITCPRDLQRAQIDLGDQDRLVLRGDACKTLTPYGALLDATCTRHDGELDVSYMSWIGKGKGAVLRIIDGCFVDSEVEPFVRRRRGA